MPDQVFFHMSIICRNSVIDNVAVAFVYHMLHRFLYEHFLKLIATVSHIQSYIIPQLMYVLACCDMEWPEY